MPCMRRRGHENEVTENAMKYTEQVYTEILEMIERLDMVIETAHQDGLLTPEQAGAVALLGPQVDNCKKLLQLSALRLKDDPVDILQAEDLYALVTEATIVVNTAINNRRDELRG